MNDVEIESLLEEAGYRFNPASGRYDAGEGEEAMDMAAEDVADLLEIPVDDLERWQLEQVPQEEQQPE